MPEWLDRFITAILSGGLMAGLIALLKVRPENHATHAGAIKTEVEAGTEMVDQAKAVVQMWQELGQQLQQKVKDLECRITVLEASEQAKAARINELETTNAAKDKRIQELEREVERLQQEVKVLKEAQGINI